MLEVAKAFLESSSAVIVDVRTVKRANQIFYTIDAKLTDGKVHTYQLRGNSLYRFNFNHKERSLVSEELVFNFTETK